MAKAKAGVGFQEILRSIQIGHYHPVYLLHGEEPYFIDAIAEELESKVLTEAEKSFNFTVFYGKDSKARQIVDTLRRFPMMAPYNVVILREAQDLPPEEFEELSTYAQKPSETSILVICHKYKSAAKLFKKISSEALVFVSESIRDYHFAAWLSEFLKQQNIRADGEAQALLSEYIGNDISTLFKALDKVKMVMGEHRVLTTDMIQSQIGRSKEYTIFDLQKAFTEQKLEAKGESKVAKEKKVNASRIGVFLGTQTKTNPIIMSVAVLYTHFNRLYQMHFLRNQEDADVTKILGLGNPYFLRDIKQAFRLYSIAELEYILSTLAEFDLKAKGMMGSKVDDSELYKEMIFRILNAPQLAAKRPAIFEFEMD
ncbi:MAG: DNA polymerase III subunit delta [Saprospiraceae bacterium]